MSNNVNNTNNTEMKKCFKCREEKYASSFGDQYNKNTCYDCVSAENALAAKKYKEAHQKEIDGLGKLSAGLKIKKYKIDYKTCYESYPCQHYVDLVLEDDTKFRTLMSSKHNVLGIDLHREPLFCDSRECCCDLS